MARKTHQTCGRKIRQGHWPSEVTSLAGPTLQCSTLIGEMAACWCMGDDFVLLADSGQIKAVEQLLKSKYTVKVVSVIGDGGLQQEAVILNRIVRYVPSNEANRMAMEIEPDQRHVDILLREHGLDDSRSKGVDIPRVKKSETQVFAGLESPPLEVVPFWSCENLIPGTRPRGCSRGSQVSPASHAKSHTIRSC